MPVEVKRIESLVEDVKPEREKENFADRWLGSFEGTISASKTSTQLMKELRGSSYGKFKE